MSSEKKLFLLDGFALIFRAYYAYIKNPLLNSKRMNVSAIYGYTNALVDLLTTEKPTHIALVLDAPGPTQRAQEFEFYKANREETPEDIKLSIPYIVKVTEAFNIPILLKEGYEADDIIGTIAKKAETEGFTTYMVTPDKDFGQLVSDKIFMYKPGRKGKPREVMGVPEILERWQIENPEQVIDILGLMGDAVDNIPGIVGVGEKTAIKLLKQFGSIENMLENTDQIKGKLREKVEASRENAIISKKLATIILDVPLEYSLEACILEEPNRKALEEVFTELEFRSIGKRILGDDFSVNKTTPSKKAKKAAATGQMDLFAPPNELHSELMSAVNEEDGGKNIENTKHDYQLIDTPQKRKELIKSLNKQKEVCFDTETTGLNANNCELVGISFSYRIGEGFYVPIPENQDEAKAIVSEFAKFFENKKIAKIGQNLKYDFLVLKWYGIEVNGEIKDTMLQHYLIEPDMRHNLNYLSETYLNYTPVAIEDLIGKKGKKQGNMRDVEVEKVKEYASEDADISLQLYKQFDAVLEKNKFQDLYKKVEAPLVNVLTEIEYNGVKVDVDFLNKYSIELESEITGLTNKIYDQSGEEFNIGSPKQLGEVLFEKMEIEYKGKKTKTGQYSTAEDTLQKLKEGNPIIENILEYRTLNKLKSTYVDAIPKLVNPRTNRIHSSFNQAVAATGRLSSSDPNLQNIPIRTERGKEVRKAFIPRDDKYTLLAADYSQIELRIIADLSKDKAMINAFKEGLDIHTATASKVYGIAMDKVDSDMRRKAKMVNFGIIYGISPFGLAQRLGVKRGEAKELIDTYFEQYPKIKEYMDSSIVKAQETGYAETILGRRRYLKDIKSKNHTVRSFAERNAINAPIQGSAADMIKVAMINVFEEMKKKKMESKMILQVHDELLFDARIDELDELQKLVEKNMVNAVKMSVPIEVGMGTGNNWLEAH